MYRQSAFGRIPPKKQSDVTVPENYSGNAFRDEPPPIENEEAESVTVIGKAVCDEAQNAAEPTSFLSGITEKLSGDSLLLLLIMFIVLGGGGEKDDGTLLSLLILLLL
jgi:hypothetical protein